jgi:hypothetical protein
MEDKVILDPCCGSKMFWFNKQHPNVIYGDKRTLTDTLCDGRTLSIQPDVEMDFTSLQFDDDTFNLVVFDPPHMTSLGANSWMAKKYGRLTDGWQQDIADGFCECLRVLKPHGVLIFKWNETDVKLSEVLELCPINPLFGHTSGRHGKTHWITYMKI